MAAVVVTAIATINRAHADIAHDPSIVLPQRALGQHKRLPEVTAMCRRTSDCASFGFNVVEAEDVVEHLRCFATRKVMHHYAYK